MIISHSKKFIFIHNYKVAGTSIRNALHPYSNHTYKSSSWRDKILFRTKIYPNIYGIQFPHHCNASYLKKNLPPQYFNSYFKFGFVRNPWDWQVSLYLYMLKEQTHPQHKLIKSFKGFNDYLHWRVNHEVRLQKDFFYDSFGACQVDFIGTYENVYEDFSHVCHQLGLKTELPHLNISRNLGSYLEYYDKSSIQRVYEVFQEDCQLFGYSVPV